MPWLDPELEKQLDHKPDLEGPFHPTGGRLLALLDEDLGREGSIFLPSKKLCCRGRVVETSPQRNKKGRLIPSELRPGDRIIFDKMAYMPLTLNGIEHVLLHEKFVLAKVEENYEMSEEGL